MKNLWLHQIANSACTRYGTMVGFSGLLRATSQPEYFESNSVGSACFTNPSPIAEGAASRSQDKCREALEGCGLASHGAHCAMPPQTCSPAYEGAPRLNELSACWKLGRWKVNAVYSLQQRSTSRDILDGLRGKRLNKLAETRSACQRRGRGREQRPHRDCRATMVTSGSRARTARLAGSCRRIGGKTDRCGRQSAGNGRCSIAAAETTEYCAWARSR